MQNHIKKLCVSESTDSDTIPMNSEAQNINTYMLNYCIPLKCSILKVHRNDSQISQVKVL